MVNKAILLGNVGKDPETNTLESGSKYCRFSLATSRKYKDKLGNKQEATTWHNIIVWDKLADVVERYVKKGDKIYIEGEIDNRSYEDKDKVKRYVSEVRATTLQMLGAKDSGSQTAPPEMEGEEPVDELPF